MIKQHLNQSAHTSVQSIINRKQGRNVVIILSCAILSACLIILFILSPDINLNPNWFSTKAEPNIFKNQTENKRTHNHQASIVKDLNIIEETSPKMVKIDKSSKYLQRFNVNGLELTYKGPSNKWTQLLAYKPISFNQTYKIKILVSFTAHSQIMIGITNHQRIQDQSSFFSQDTYTYYGENGCLWAEGKLIQKDEKGFKEKEIIEIDVQLWKGIIQWRVNGAIRAQVYSDNLKEQKKKFVPYLEMFEKEDSIRIIL